ncbi:MAG: ABC transporter substrate-binding protein [Crocinitomicaceae bacterium]|nr:ABC transporter substrate-binding protein [Crocinitomicaceae bacterium]
MMTLILIRKFSYTILLVSFLTSCIQHHSENNIPEIISVTDTIHIKYAEGFEVNYKTGLIEIITRSIEGNSFFSDSLYILTDEVSNNLAENPTLKATPQILACQSSTHLAFLDALNCLDKVKGMCGLEYIPESDLKDELIKNKVVEICNSESVNMELLQKVSPDLFLIYPFETEGKDKYESAGINTFFIAEYLEKSALARLEWIKLFGLILNKTTEANVFFEKAEKEYLDLKSKSKNDSLTFILNLPYKDSWFMPSAGSLLVKLIEDAGLNYYYPESGSTENDIHSSEEVWNDGMVADYWIVIAGRPDNFSLADLINEQPVYAEFKSVKNNNVLFCNSSTTDYFTKGVIEPQVILKICYMQPAH